MMQVPEPQQRLLAMQGTRNELREVGQPWVDVDDIAALSSHFILPNRLFSNPQTHRLVQVVQLIQTSREEQYEVRLQTWAT